MLTLLRILTGLIVLLVILALASFLLPREIRVERKTVIDAPTDEVFPYVNALQKTEAWSPWIERDPDIQLTYSGPNDGVGNKVSWTSEHPEVGSGSQEIVESNPNDWVASVLDFGPMGTADAYFELTAVADAQTEITWGFTMDAGLNPIERYMGLMMDRWVGGDYEAGLARLKALAEGA